MGDLTAGISVVLATCNGGRFLGRQLRSLAWQQRLPDELIVRDDRSSDDTVAMVRDFAATAPFPVRVLVNDECLGAAKNFEAGIRDAGGGIIATCDQDDVWYPEKLAEFERAFADGGADLVFCDADAVDLHLSPLGYTLWQSVGFGRRQQSLARRRGLLDVLVKFNVVSGAAMAFRASCRDRILPIGGDWVHDGWIAIILAAAGRCVWIDHPLLAYRQHIGQQIGAARRTLGRQIATARDMDEAYFSRLADHFTEAARRAGTDAHVQSRLAAKIVHCRRKAGMRRAGSRLRRLPAIAGEIAAGRYWTVALGFKSIAADLLL